MVDRDLTVEEEAALPEPTWNSQLDRELKEIVAQNPKCYMKVINSKGFAGRYLDRKYLRDYINSVTPFLQDKFYSIQTKLYWIFNHLKYFPRCKSCSKPLKLWNIKKLADNYGYKAFCSKECRYHSEEAKSRLESAFVKKYGVKNAFQIDSVKKKLAANYSEIRRKADSTKKRNHTFKKSFVEDRMFKLLKLHYDPDLVRQHKTDKYPFFCDFYSPKHDQYIEFMGTWTHGGHPFDSTSKEDQQTLESWKQKAVSSKFYANAIDTWTRRDPEKRLAAKANNLNYVELWSVNEAAKLAGIDFSGIKDLYVPWLKDLAESDLAFYKRQMPTALPKAMSHNYIIKHFQQDTFYAAEKQLWLDSSIRKKLIANRCKYLGKEEDQLDVLDLLDGFKKSGIYYGYSHFNPLWFKWFILKFGCKVCYDPCGGWGHRVLGGLSLEKYIYNDLSQKTKLNVDCMLKKLSIRNTVTSCNDARSYVPAEDFDSMFTCPPYFNLEKYECGEFKSKADFDSFIDSLFNVFQKKQSCKVFGLVIREDLLAGHKGYAEKHILTVQRKKHLNSTSNKHDECLFVYKK